MCKWVSVCGWSGGVWRVERWRRSVWWRCGRGRVEEGGGWTRRRDQEEKRWSVVGCGGAWWWSEVWWREVRRKRNGEMERR